MSLTVDSATEFTYAVLPDTQHYSANNNGIFEAMTQWIADNQATYNIQMVVHEGDLVHGYDDATAEWDVAETAISTLDDNNIPALLAVGNHDAVQGDPRSLPTFRARFPTSRYSNLVTAVDSVKEYGTYDGNPETAYLLQESNGESVLYLAVEFGPRDAVMGWADSVVSSHSEAHCVFVTHSFMYWDGSRVSSGDDYAPGTYNLSDYNNGEEMWQGWCSGWESLRTVHSGHHINGPPVSKRSDYADAGNGVSQQLCNYQTLSNGGDGILRLVTIDTESLTARVNQYSTVNDTWSSTFGEAFTIPFENWLSRVSQTDDGMRQVSFGR